jgi:hypothetical protein
VEERAMTSWISPIGKLILLIPMPRILDRILATIDESASSTGEWAAWCARVIVVSSVAYGVVWVWQIPLGLFWRLFGWIASNDPTRLQFYNHLGHAVAFILAARFVLAMREGTT